MTHKTYLDHVHTIDRINGTGGGFGAQAATHVGNVLASRPSSTDTFGRKYISVDHGGQHTYQGWKNVFQRNFLMW